MEGPEEEDVAKNERVSRWESWVVGADLRAGRLFVEAKPVMLHRTIQFSLAALERMRSPWKVML